MLTEILINRNNTPRKQRSKEDGRPKFPTELLVDVFATIKTSGIVEQGFGGGNDCFKNWSGYCINLLTCSGFVNSFAGSAFKNRKVEKLFILNTICYLPMDFTQFVGKWKLTKTTNFGEFLNHVGVDEDTRSAVLAIDSLKPVLDIEVAGDRWKMVTTTFCNASWVNEFNLGVEKQQATAEGRVVKSTFEFLNGKLVEEQKLVESAKRGEKGARVERKVLEGGKVLVARYFRGQVEATRTFEKI